MTVAEEIAARYLAVFHEPDPAARQAAVAALWSADARLCTAANDYAGHDAITRRVTLAHEKFIIGQHMAFRLQRQHARPAA